MATHGGFVAVTVIGRRQKSNFAIVAGVQGGDGKQVAAATPDASGKSATAKLKLSRKWNWNLSIIDPAAPASQSTGYFLGTVDRSADSVVIDLRRVHLVHIQISARSFNQASFEWTDYEFGTGLSTMRFRLRGSKLPGQCVPKALLKYFAERTVANNPSPGWAAFETDYAFSWLWGTSLLHGEGCELTIVNDPDDEPYLGDPLEFSQIVTHACGDVNLRFEVSPPTTIVDMYFCDIEPDPATGIPTYVEFLPAWLIAPKNPRYEHMPEILETHPTSGLASDRLRREFRRIGGWTLGAARKRRYPADMGPLGSVVDLPFPDLDIAPDSPYLLWPVKFGRVEPAPIKVEVELRKNFIGNFPHIKKFKFKIEAFKAPGPAGTGHGSTVAEATTTLEVDTDITSLGEAQLQVPRGFWWVVRTTMTNVDEETNPDHPTSANYELSTRYPVCQAHSMRRFVFDPG